MSCKNCPICGLQGSAYDSRQMKEYVRRRYRCTCGRRWTTAEFLVADETNNNEKVQQFLKRKGFEAAREALAPLKALFDNK